jgi:hypothetical protein
MQKTTVLVTQSKKHPNEYVNTETGETLGSETNDKISITMKEATGLFEIDSNDYIVFDSGAIAYLESVLGNADVQRVNRMARMLKTDCSILCQDNNHPHSPETLSVIFNLSKNKFYEMIRRLVSKNILSYCVCAPSGYVQKIYMLNPYIARKRKNFNCELLVFFRDITKE